MTWLQRLRLRIFSKHGKTTAAKYRLASRKHSRKLGFGEVHFRVLFHEPEFENRACMNISWAKCNKVKQIYKFVKERYKAKPCVSTESLHLTFNRISAVNYAESKKIQFLTTWPLKIKSNCGLKNKLLFCFWWKREQNFNNTLHYL